MVTLAEMLETFWFFFLSSHRVIEFYRKQRDAMISSAEKWLKGLWCGGEKKQKNKQPTTASDGVYLQLKYLRFIKNFFFSNEHIPVLTLSVCVCVIEEEEEEKRCH